MEVQHIPTTQLKANAWNPNRMDDSQFAELVAEVKHLNRLPKPVVVRKNCDGYEVVDGEHGWRAAIEVGLENVACEVVEADDFEAMRQTYKRNQHGKHDPVLEGRMFREMRNVRDTSNRELARELDMSEGTIRNAILYADVADSLPEDMRDTVTRLKVSDVRSASRLSRTSAVYWIRNRCPYGQYEKLQEWIDGGEGGGYLHDLIEKHDLSPLFEKNPFNDAIRLADSAARNLMRLGELPGATEAMRSLIDRGYGVDAFCEHFSYTDDFTVPVMTQPVWDGIVSRAVKHGGDVAQSIAHQVDALRTRRPPSDDGYNEENPYVFSARHALSDAPGFITELKMFNIVEQMLLWETLKGVGDEIRDVATEAMQEVAATYDSRRDLKLKVADDEDRSQLLASWSPTGLDSLQDEWQAIVTKKIADRALEERRQQLRNRDAMLSYLRESAKNLYVFREQNLGERRGLDVFMERIESLDLPELSLVVSSLGGEDCPLMDWWRIAKEHCVTVTQESADASDCATVTHEPGETTDCVTVAHPDQSFPIENQDGEWVIIMPDQTTTGTFKAKRQAEEQARKYRKQAKDDPQFLDDFNIKKPAKQEA
jgi:ParB/RepB/Spo0J family partition protein